jgi:hypothetical protein
MKDGKDEVLSRDKIVRYIDLSEHLRRYYGSDPVNSRGSWVEAHLKADPTSVAYETHEVAEHVRILNPQHHQRYIETHGTNEVIVHSHKRRTPKLAHVEHITKMTARRFRHKP